MSYRNLTVDLTASYPLAVTANAILDAFVVYGPRVDSYTLHAHVAAEPGASLACFNTAKRALRNMGYNLKSTRGPGAVYDLDPDAVLTQRGVTDDQEYIYTMLLGCARRFTNSSAKDPAYLPALHQVQNAAMTVGLGMGLPLAQITADLAPL